MVREHSPADFVVEYIAQTHGWFYAARPVGGPVRSTGLLQRHLPRVVLDHEGLSKEAAQLPGPRRVTTLGSTRLAGT